MGLSQANSDEDGSCDYIKHRLPISSNVSNSGKYSHRNVNKVQGDQNKGTNLERWRQNLMEVYIFKPHTKNIHCGQTIVRSVEEMGLSEA